MPFGIGALAVPLTVTVSIGLAEFRSETGREDASGDAQRIVADADKALYEAKAAGRNVVALAAA
jgi:PleD family two-component response regulator